MKQNMKINIALLVCLPLAALSLHSCLLDYDNPGDELTGNEKQSSGTIYYGNADHIDYTKEITQAGFAASQDSLKTLLGQLITAEYAMRGGKEGNQPGPHAYQYQFSLCVDNYAGYFCLPQNFNGRITSTYYVNTDFNGGPNGSFMVVKNALVPLLNHPQIDSIPEMKAVALLLYDYSSQEIGDLYGAFPYVDYKNNKQAHPYTHNSLNDIYFNIVNNLDTIVACFDRFESRPQWYKDKISSMLNRYDELVKDKKIDTWKRFANSLKLRMAMHCAKVEPQKAQAWAQEAVLSGVIESTSQEVAVSPAYSGFTNPLLEISETWNDTRLNASFESLLMSLNHPYASYLFLKNSDALINAADNSKVLPAGTRVVGLRAGLRMLPGQTYAVNERDGYSKLNNSVIAMCPLYLMKLSEVAFLRAEGALRGWNMQGTASGFYEQGLQYAYLEDRDFSSQYTAQLDSYKNLDKAVAYTYEDPMDAANNHVSVTSIGVKWNDADDRETKLEKIITQKYIALFPYSYEAWSEMRRTGYPKLFPVLNVEDGDKSLKEGDLIRRMPFPGDTEGVLQDIATSGLKALGGADLQATRVWWDNGAANF